MKNKHDYQSSLMMEKCLQSIFPPTGETRSIKVSKLTSAPLIFRILLVQSICQVSILSTVFWQIKKMHIIQFQCINPFLPNQRVPDFLGCWAMLLTTESCGMSKVSLSLETTLPHHLQWIFKHIKCILFLIPLPLINKTSVCYSTNNIHEKFMQFWLAEKVCIFHVTWLQSYYTCAKL